MHYFFSSFVFSQKTIINDIKEQNLKKIKNVRSKNKNSDSKVYNSMLDNHFTMIENQVKKGYDKNIFVLDSLYSRSVRNIFNKLKYNNKQLDLGNPNFYIVKSNMPNASSLGFDYYFLNSQLFNLLENQYQLAAVIGHERSHNYLKHTNKDIKRNADFLNDFKKEMRTIKRREFIKLIKSQDEIIQKKYDLASQSRAKVISADSLGFILYSNSGYPKSEYLKMLKKLQAYEKKDYKKVEDSTYYKIFQIGTVKLNPQQLKLTKNESFEGLNFHEIFDEDSIKSHPDTNVRIDWVSNNFHPDRENGIEIEINKDFLRAKKIEETSFYENYYVNNKYGLALYDLIYERQINPNIKISIKIYL